MLTTEEKRAIETGCALRNLGERLQTELEVAGGAFTLEGSNNEDLVHAGAIIADKDNATALRVRGAQHSSEGGAKVQSYIGIFNNNGYDTVGTLKTRFIIGSNLEMDGVLISPHQLQLVASDNTQADGEIFMASKTKVRINARVNPEIVAPNELLIDRVDQGSVDGSNTSDVNVDVSGGNLRLMAGNTDGAVVLQSLTDAERDALTPVVGMIIFNTDNNQFEGYDGAWKALPAA